MFWVIAVPIIVLEEVQFWTVKSVSLRATIVLILSPLKTFGVNVQARLEHMSMCNDGDE